MNWPEFDVLRCQVCGETALSVNHESVPEEQMPGGETVGHWMHEGGKRCSGLEKRRDYRIVRDRETEA